MSGTITYKDIVNIMKGIECEEYCVWPTPTFLPLPKFYGPTLPMPPMPKFYGPMPKFYGPMPAIPFILTHTKILWTHITHATHATVWSIPPMNLHTHTAHATYTI